MTPSDLTRTKTVLCFVREKQGRDRQSYLTHGLSSSGGDERERLKKDERMKRRCEMKGRMKRNVCTLYS